MDRSADIQSVCGAPREERREAVLCNDLLALLAGWRKVERACEELGSGLLKTTQTQVALEYCTKAETWRRAIAGLEAVVGGLASEANDPKLSDSGAWRGSCQGGAKKEAMDVRQRRARTRRLRT